MIQEEIEEMKHDIARLKIDINTINMRIKKLQEAIVVSKSEKFK